MTVAADTVALNIMEGLVFINKLKLLKVFAICETVDHSSDIQQTPPLTKIWNF